MQVSPTLFGNRDNEFYPDLQQWTLTLGFEFDASGAAQRPAAPALGLQSAYGVLGDGWVDDPRLAALCT